MNQTLRIGLYLRHSDDTQENSASSQLAVVMPYLRARPHYLFRGAKHPLLAGNFWENAAAVDELLKVAEKENWHLFADRAIQGWRDDRPGFQRLLTCCREGGLDLILVDQGSRLSRQKPVEFFARVADPLMQAGVQVESVQRGRTLDWNDIGDFLIQAVEQQRDYDEGKNTSWRVLRDELTRASRAALYQGKAPYGYRKGKHPDGRPTYVPGPAEEREVIQWIFYAYGRLGWSIVDIVQDLNERGKLTPTGGTRWHRSLVGRYLRDPVYIGSYRWNQRSQGKFYRMTQSGPVAKADSGATRSTSWNKREDWVIVPESHESLVDGELFNDVQRLLTENRRHTSPSRTRRDWTLSGLLVCAECECKLVGSRPKEIIYRCEAGNAAGVHPPYRVRETEILADILAAIQRFASQDNLARLRQLAREAIERACKPASLDALRTERAGLEKQMGQARRNLALLADPDDVQAVAAQIGVWKARVEEIDDLVRESERPKALTVLEDAIAEMERLLGDLREVSKDADPRKLRALLMRLIKRVLVKVEAVPCGKYHHYKLLPGVIELNPGTALSERAGGLLDLSTGGTSVGQLSQWLVRFAG